MVEVEYGPMIVTKAERNLKSDNVEKREEAHAACEKMKLLEKVISLDPTDAYWNYGENRAQDGLAFVHGDMVIQNVLFSKGEDGWKAVGVLDLGDCGYGDRRYDLATACHSLRYLLKKNHPDLVEEAQNAFLDEYGMPRGDACGWEVWDAAYDLFDYYVYDLPAALTRKAGVAADKFILDPIGLKTGVGTDPDKFILDPIAGAIGPTKLIFDPIIPTFDFLRPSGPAVSSLPNAPPLD
ncbi:hypothetical protein HDU67_005082, partial [Dinochytrium kinnereticum]